MSAIRIGVIRPRREVGATRREENHNASIRMVASLANSTGWPIRIEPIASQLLLLACPAGTGPDHERAIRSARPMPYSQGVAHSSSRKELR